MVEAVVDDAGSGRPVAPADFVSCFEKNLQNLLRKLVGGKKHRRIFLWAGQARREVIPVRPVTCLFVPLP